VRVCLFDVCLCVTWFYPYGVGFWCGCCYGGIGGVCGGINDVVGISED